MEPLQTWWATELYPTSDEDNFGVVGNFEVVKAADAQATIAALQARVQELEQWVQDQSTANLETMRHMDEMQSRAMDAEAQLTQRTAELEAVKADTKNMLDVATSRLREQVADLQAELEAVRVDNRTYINERHENMKQIEQLQADLAERTAELEAAKAIQAIDLKNNNAYREQVANLQAELERVSLLSSHNERRFEMLDKKYKELRTLLLALPKVEVVTGDTVVNIVQQYNFHQWMLRALQHRQGMEG